MPVCLRRCSSTSGKCQILRIAIWTGPLANTCLLGNARSWKLPFTHYWGAGCGGQQRQCLIIYFENSEEFIMPVLLHLFSEMPDRENCHLHTGLLALEANNAIGRVQWIAIKIFWKTWGDDNVSSPSFWEMPDRENCHLHTGLLAAEANNAIARGRIAQ